MNNRKKTPFVSQILWPVHPSLVADALKRKAADGWKVKSITPISRNLTEIVFYK